MFVYLVNEIGLIHEIFDTRKAAEEYIKRLKTKNKYIPIILSVTKRKVKRIIFDRIKNGKRKAKSTKRN